MADAGGRPAGAAHRAAGAAAWRAARRAARRVRPAQRASAQLSGRWSIAMRSSDVLGAARSRCNPVLSSAGAVAQMGPAVVKSCTCCPKCCLFGLARGAGAIHVPESVHSWLPYTVCQYATAHSKLWFVFTPWGHCWSAVSKPRSEPPYTGPVFQGNCLHLRCLLDTLLAPRPRAACAG